eukprot:9699936-Alexandrium_andersonii.AAC.1
MSIGPCAGRVGVVHKFVQTRWFHWTCAWASCGSANVAAPRMTIIPARAGGSASPTARQSVAKSPE